MSGSGGETFVDCSEFDSGGTVAVSESENEPRRTQQSESGGNVQSQRQQRGGQQRGGQQRGGQGMTCGSVYARAVRCVQASS